MDAQLIVNINKFVMPDDELYHLGDWSVWYGRDYLQHAINCRRQINCKNITLIEGNHEIPVGTCPEFDNGFIKRTPYLELKYYGTLFILFHYRITTWNQKHKNSIQLFGHEHNLKHPDKFENRQLEVGQDCNNYLPLSINEVITMIEK